MLKVQGIIRATRYINLDPKANRHPKFLAICEIKTDDINTVDTVITENDARNRARGRISHLMIGWAPVGKRFYRQIMPLKQARHSKK